MEEDEMVWWHYWLNGHEFEYTLRVCDVQRSLECGTLWSPWGHKESDTTEWAELNLGKYAQDKEIKKKKLLNILDWYEKRCK